MTASISLSNYVHNNEHFVLYIEYHWKIIKLSSLLDGYILWDMSNKVYRKW